MNPTLPDIIFLYGPAGCGKGTQSYYLLKQYPSLHYIELGSILRSFVAKYSTSDNTTSQIIATHMNLAMQQGMSIDFADWKHVWNTEVASRLTPGTTLLIDGALREYNQSLFLSNFILDKKLQAVLFALHITLDEAKKRLSTRWYSPSSQKPFATYQEAADFCVGDEKPYNRKDDTNLTAIENRYKNQYETMFGKCVSLYQRVTGGDVYIIDGEQLEEDVFVQINQNLNNFSKKSSRLRI